MDRFVSHAAWSLKHYRQGYLFERTGHTFTDTTKGELAALVTFASLGVGLIVSVAADSERQAVQLAMLILLASVFLSGFVVPLDEFRPPVQWLAYLLPATHGIQLFQDLMLRGGTYVVWQGWALAAGGIALFAVTAALFKRELARA